MKNGLHETEVEPTDAQRAALLAILKDWGVPPADMVGKLPRVTCRDCTQKSCREHKKQMCPECHAVVSVKHIHLDFMGHADVTRALIQIDPLWSWEPMAFGEDGLPKVGSRGKTAELWGRLTVHGCTKPGVGTCEDFKGDLAKELIGDFLRNAGMRFGIGLSLWSKSEWEEGHDDTPEPPPRASADDETELNHRAKALPEDFRADLKSWAAENGIDWPKRPPLAAQVDAIRAELDVLEEAARTLTEDERPFTDDEVSA